MVVKLYKLVSGEIVVGRVKEEDNEAVWLEKPAALILVPAESKAGGQPVHTLTFVPFILGMNPDGVCRLSKQTVVAEVGPTDVMPAVKNRYLAETTGLIPPDEKEVVKAKGEKIRLVK